MQYKNRLERHLILNVDSVHAVPHSMKPRLVLRVSATPTFGFGLSVLGIEGGVSLQTPAGQQFIGKLYREAGSTPPYPLEFSDGHERQDQLVVDLDWQTIYEIERHRNGGDLRLRATLQFACAGLAQSNEVQSLFWLPVDLERNRNSEVVIHQREWVEALNRWGFADIRIIEIVIPLDEVRKQEFCSALNHIGEANQKFLTGDYPSTMVACRKAAESLQVSVKEYAKALNGDKGHSIRRDNTEALFKALRGFFAVGAHDGHPATRAEAALAVSMCKEFLSFMGKQERPVPAQVGTTGTP